MNQPTIGLVLTGGGARGAYQAGVLTAISEIQGQDLHIPIVTGVSAGAINAALLASHPGPFSETVRDLREAWLGLTMENVFKIESRGLFRALIRWLWLLSTHLGSDQLEVRGFLNTQPLLEYLKHHADLSGIRRNLESGRLSALALTATSYATGLTINFIETSDLRPGWKRAGRQGVHTTIDYEHVMASSALPLIFPAIQINNSFYGDGSLRLQTPLAPAIHLGADKLLVISVRYKRTPEEEILAQVQGYPPPAQVLGMLLNAVFLDALETDLERARRINHTLSLLGSEKRRASGMKRMELIVLRPSLDLGKLAADIKADMPGLLKVIVRGLGTQYSKTPDFLSYLLFEQTYVKSLMELGYRDTLLRQPEIEHFLAIDPAA